MVTKEKRKRQNVSKNFMKLLWNWDFVVNNFVKYYTDINLTKSLQNFVKLLSICYFWHFVVKNFAKLLSKVKKKLQTKKVDKIFSNVCEFCFNSLLMTFNYCQCFVKEATYKMLNNCRQSLVITTTNNWGKRCCRDKHKFKLLL